MRVLTGRQCPNMRCKICTTSRNRENTPRNTPATGMAPVHGGGKFACENEASLEI